MKKLIFILLVLPFIKVQSQERAKRSESYFITICKDAMNDKEYAFGSKKLVCIDDKVNKNAGFSVSISWHSEGGIVEYGGLIVKSAGVGKCMESDELIILFEDDTKVKLTSWNDFNCDGDSYFDLHHSEFDNINDKKVKAIRLTNGRSFESLTYKLKPDEVSYFRDARSALSLKQFKKGKCD